MKDRRKPKSNAVLKNLPSERQEQVAEWCAKRNDKDDSGRDIPRTGGLAFAQQQLAADGIKLSISVIGVFYSWWCLERDLEISFEREQQVLAQTGDPKKAREAGETLLMRLGLATADPKLIVAAAQTSDNRRALDLEEKSGKTKAEQKERSLAQKDEEIKLAERKFRRDTCREFIKWYDNVEAKRIVTGAGSNAEKIEALGRAMFGEDWDQ